MYVHVHGLFKAQPVAEYTAAPGSGKLPLSLMHRAGRCRRPAGPSRMHQQAANGEWVATAT